MVEIKDLFERLVRLESNFETYKDSCSLPAHKAEVHEKINGLRSSMDKKYESAWSILKDKFDNLSKNYRTLIGVLVTVGLVVLGSLATLQIKKLDKDDFKTYVGKQESYQKEQADYQKEVIGMIGTVNQHLSKIEGKLEEHDKNREVERK